VFTACFLLLQLVTLLLDDISTDRKMGSFV